MELIRYTGTFPDCKAQIEKAGQRIATARQGMQDRIRQGPDSHYLEGGCWHPEGTARINGTNYWCLGKFAPTTHYPRKTLKANKSNKYLPLTDEIKLGEKPAVQLIKEIAEQDAELPAHKKRVLIPKEQYSFPVPSEDLGDVDIAQFLARDPKLAGRYGKFLKNKCEIPKVWFNQIGNNWDNVGAGLWLHGLDLGDDSDFYGNLRGFYYADGGSLFGVSPEVRSTSERKSL